MRFAQVAAWACLLVAPLAGHAGDASAAFEIRVTLQSGAGLPGNPGTPPDGGSEGSGAICTSQARGSGRTAVIEVLCAVGPYVSIAPADGTQEASGDPWRYEFGPRSPLVRAALTLGSVRTPQLAGGGTLTTLQVTNASGDGSALEML